MVSDTIHMAKGLDMLVTGATGGTGLDVVRRTQARGIAVGPAASVGVPSQVTRASHATVLADLAASSQHEGMAVTVTA